MEIRPIKTEADYAAAMRRIESVWGAASGTVEEEELEVLVTLAEAYERQHYPIDPARRASRALRPTRTAKRN